MGYTLKNEQKVNIMKNKEEFIICDKCDDVKLKNHKCHAMNTRSKSKAQDWVSDLDEDDCENIGYLLFANNREYSSAMA
jgi:hypothetical protein